MSIQDDNKDFRALVVDKTLALTILINSHDYQDNAGTNKTYFLIKRNFFQKGM